MMHLPSKLRDMLYCLTT